MDRITADILAMLGNDIETSYLIAEYLNALVMDGQEKPYFEDGQVLTVSHVQKALDRLMEEGLVKVYVVEKDDSLPELHGPWYGLTDGGWEAIGEKPRDYFAID